MEEYNNNIRAVTTIQKFIKKSYNIEKRLKSSEIVENFVKEVQGYHIIHNSPIKEAVWESVNENVVKKYLYVCDTAKGNHKSGKDMKIGCYDISNKSCKIDKGKINISSYRLTKVCNNKNHGILEEIVGEIHSRDKSFDYYSLLCREELEDGIKYYWCVVPKEYYIFDVSVQNLKKINGNGKNSDTIVGWKGKYCDIRFSMSSQLWYHFDFSQIKKFIICETFVKYKATLQYSDIYTLYSAVKSLSI